jgi:hypothetical protein
MICSGLAAQVDDHLGLGEVEVDGAALAPAGGEETAQRLRALERLQQVAQVPPHFGIPLDERLLHAPVREPRMAPHDGVVERRAEEAPARLVLEPHRFHEAVLAGLQLQMPADSSSGSIGMTRSGK